MRYEDRGTLGFGGGGRGKRFKQGGDLRGPVAGSKRGTCRLVPCRVLFLLFIALTLCLLSCQRERSEISLRKFPFPYQAALAICSDVDYTSAQEFKEIHRTFEEIGLPLAGSFWMYNPKPYYTPKGYSRERLVEGMAYFEGLSSALSPEADKIREFYRRGWLDSLHSYGNFSTPRHRFSREMAVSSINQLREHGIKIIVWINHGNEYNTQNLNRGIGYHRGAQKDSKEYHADLTTRYGIKFVWNMGMTNIVGQDRHISSWEAMDFDVRHPFSSLMRFVKLFVGDETIWTLNKDNRVIEPFELDDGTSVYVFKRFNNHPENIWKGAGAKDLARQLAPNIIRKLEECGGYMVVYTHLGLNYPFDDASLAALRYVAAEYQQGRVWVTTTSQLLAYNLAYRYLKWN